jgi:hypothetical protein
MPVLPCRTVLQVWPTELLAPRPVGRMVLDTNIDNFFAEAEQIAFCPAITVPGGGGGPCVTAEPLCCYPCVTQYRTNLKSCSTRL